MDPGSDEGLSPVFVSPSLLSSRLSQTIVPKSFAYIKTNVVAVLVTMSLIPLIANIWQKHSGAEKLTGNIIPEKSLPLHKL